MKASWLILILLGAPLFAVDRHGAIGNRPEISEREKWKSMILGCPILNEAGRETVPRRESQPAPTGVLLRFQEGSEGYGVCQATHVSPGRMISKAHCFDATDSKSHYGLLYFDPEGKKKFVYLQDSDFESDPIQDTLSLNLPLEIEESWPVLSEESVAVRKQGGKPFSASAYVFDPVQFYPELYQHNKCGWVYRKKSYLASSHAPLMAKTEVTGTRWVPTPASEDVMYFQENGNGESAHAGNSGAYLTDESGAYVGLVERVVSNEELLEFAKQQYGKEASYSFMGVGGLRATGDWQILSKSPSFLYGVAGPAKPFWSAP